MGEEITMKDFFSREKSNSGILAPLYYPNGGLSEHWIRVRGVDSDAFRRADTESRREMMDFARELARDLADKKLTPEQEREARQAFLEQSKLKIIASLAIEWSLPEEFNRDMVITFLTESPHNADNIDKLVYDRVAFFKKKSMPS